MSDEILLHRKRTFRIEPNGYLEKSICGVDLHMVKINGYIKSGVMAAIDESHVLSKSMYMIILALEVTTWYKRHRDEIWDSDDNINFEEKLSSENIIDDNFEIYLPHRNLENCRFMNIERFFAYKIREIYTRGMAECPPIVPVITCVNDIKRSLLNRIIMTKGFLDDPLSTATKIYRLSDNRLLDICDKCENQTDINILIFGASMIFCSDFDLQNQIENCANICELMNVRSENIATGIIMMILCRDVWSRAGKISGIVELEHILVEVKNKSIRYLSNSWRIVNLRAIIHMVEVSFLPVPHDIGGFPYIIKLLRSSIEFLRNMYRHFLNGVNVVKLFTTYIHGLKSIDNSDSIKILFGLLLGCINPIALANSHVVTIDSDVSDSMRSIIKKIFI
jgi:hypothetical protein